MNKQLTENIKEVKQKKKIVRWKFDPYFVRWKFCNCYLIRFHLVILVQYSFKRDSCYVHLFNKEERKKEIYSIILAKKSPFLRDSCKISQLTLEQENQFFFFFRKIDFKMKLTILAMLYQEIVVWLVVVIVERSFLLCWLNHIYD